MAAVRAARPRPTSTGSSPTSRRLAPIAGEHGPLMGPPDGRRRASRLAALAKSFDDVAAVDRDRPRHPGRPVLLAARRLRLRQDHDAADDRRLREARLRPDPARRSRRGGRSAAPAPGQHRLPDLRAVPVHDGAGQRRLRAAATRRRPKADDQATRRRGARAGPDGRASPSAGRPSCPAASSSASPWPARWCSTRRCCCSTSRSAPWTPSCASTYSSSCAPLQREVGITFVYVTHDQEEALTMSDRIAVIADGKVEQVGPPEEIYSRPATTFVAGFLGAANIFDADVIDVSGRLGDLLGAGPHQLAAAVDGDAPRGEAAIVIRPERIAVQGAERRRSRSGHNAIRRHGRSRWSTSARPPRSTSTSARAAALLVEVAQPGRARSRSRPAGRAGRLRSHPRPCRCCAAATPVPPVLRRSSASASMHRSGRATTVGRAPASSS